MKDYTFARKKVSTSTFTNPSLVSSHTPTLANPVRGFGLPTNNVIQTQTAESAEQQAAQAADERAKLLLALEQPSFGHHISRIALRRPQAKLTIGEPGDKYEQEADWMANQVMRMVVPDKPNADGVQPVEDTLQRKCTDCEQEEEKVQTKPSIERATDGGLQAGDNIENRLNSSKGGGSPLAPEVQSFMEPRFGADFSGVRVHTDTDAVQMNRELGAQAFTHGSDVYFGEGRFPGANALTAHELTHVVQQNSPTLIQSRLLAIQRSVTFDDCEAREYEVKNAHDKAIEMCKKTIAQLNTYDGTKPANVKTALAKHFHSTTHKWYFSISEIVAANLADVLKNAEDVQYECHDQEDYGTTLAWSMWCVPFTDILLYKKWFAATVRGQANTLVHEWMHRYGCDFDLGYDWEPEYIDGGTFRAIHNAEPYGNIVEELG